MESKRLYVAAHSKSAARNVARRLREAGHVVTSRWIDIDDKFGDPQAYYTDSERRGLATIDEQDVRSATDGLVLISESAGEYVPGGKHVETGIALGLGRTIYILGRRENIFHWHPRCFRFQDIDSLLQALDSLDKTRLFPSG